jgi:hypothetical protein
LDQARRDSGRNVDIHAEHGRARFSVLPLCSRRADGKEHPCAQGACHMVFRSNAPVHALAEGNERRNEASDWLGLSHRGP